MDTWAVAQAKARLSEVLDRAKELGPQTILKMAGPPAIES